MARDPTYLHPSKTIAMRVFPGVVLQVFAGQVTRDHLANSLHMLEHPVLGDRYVQVVHVAPTGIKEIPDDDFRKLAAETLKRQSGRLVALAYIVGGEGFLSSMARTVIAGVSLLSRTSHTEKVFSDKLGAVTWLAPHSVGDPLVPADLVRALDESIALTR